MKKNNYLQLSLLIVAFLTGACGYAQSIAPQSVNSGGSKMTQANGSLSFTVGELLILSQTDSQGNTLGSGFSSGATLTTLSIQETNTSVLDVKVFPNPTSELINIKINYSRIDQILIIITDMQGKEVYSGKYSGISNLIGINTASYDKANYILSIKTLNNQLLATYKIIKH